MGVIGDDLSQQIWEQLEEVALKDGIITPEENKLISNIVLNVKTYSKMLDDALEDGYISKNEKISLFEGRIAIVERAYSIARNDSKITPDEANILKSIVSLVMEMEKK